MGRREKSKSKKSELEEDEEAHASTPLVVASSDDDEANEDLSLKIVEKALRKRAPKLVLDDVVRNGDDLGASSSQRHELAAAQYDGVLNGKRGTAGSEVDGEEIKSEKKKKTKKTTKKKVECGDVPIAEAHEPIEEGKDGDDVSASTSQQHGLAEYKGVLNGRRGIAGSEVDGEAIKSEKKKKTKKTKVKKVECGDASVLIDEEQESAETINFTEKDKPVAVEECKVQLNDEPAEVVTVKMKDEPAEAGTVQISDNSVLRKLLRGPRYFDPPEDSGWGTCYNCGEDGHAAVNCTAARRKKPCFICGSLEHSVKQCNRARDCFICKKGRHRAKDCPEKFNSISNFSRICLRCGNSGHEMFSCKNDYSLDDLKEIQCYICKGFGHLCCVNPIDATRIEISCYRCGQLGHTGLACSRLRTDTTDTHADSPSSCYKCGEEGHFARECLSSLKVGKRRHEFSNTKVLSFQKENDNVGSKSAPSDMVKVVKKKKPLTEERGMITPQKSKHRVGWMTEHPGEFSPSKSKRTSWRSQATPSTKSSYIHSFSNGSHTPSSNKSYKMRDVHDGTPDSRGSANASHKRFSASRFGNSINTTTGGSVGAGSSYNWW